MMRPIYRWKGFWLGVLVVVFLGWGWVRSLSYKSYLDVRCDGPDVGLYVGQEEGMILVGVIGNTDVGGVNFRDERLPTWMRVKWLAPPGHGYVDEGNLIVSMAHWVAMLLFLGVWVAWLRRRWRRNIEHRTSNIEHRTSNIER